MESIYAIIDIAQNGMAVENLRAQVAAQNIAQVNTPGYIPRSVSVDPFFAQGTPDGQSSGNGDLSIAEVTDAPTKKISLDTEVVQASNAELRYQVMAEMIQKKFGMLELAYGVKK